MQFTVFALASVPDTDTTRQLFELHDLDDKSVSKVMFHRRKQQTGSSEILRWDQRAIASLTLIHHFPDRLAVDSMSLDSHSEQEMLQAFFDSALAQGPLLSWGGEALGLPLMHFRALKHMLPAPAYWQALNAGEQPHLDIRTWMSPDRSDLPELNAMSRKVGYPGLLGRTEDDVMDDWLSQRLDSALAFSDLSALNAYLLALRLFTVTGELGRDEHQQAQGRLHDHLQDQDAEHLTAFRAAWSRA